MFLTIKDHKADQQFLNWLSQQKDGKYWVRLEKLNKRSNPQNALMWLWLSYIAENTGEDVLTEFNNLSRKDSFHEVYKRLFLPPEFVIYRGREIKLPSTTTTLSKGDFTMYLERIQAEASEMGIVLPQPPVLQ